MRRYPLAEIVEGCLLVYTRGISSGHGEATAPPAASSGTSSATPTEPGARSHAVREALDVPGIGQFTAYQDGRIAVVFADRTLLKLQGPQESAFGMAGGSPSPTRTLHLLDREGVAHNLRALAPIGFERYAQLALDFEAWACKGPEARAADAARAQHAARQRQAIVQRSAGYAQSEEVRAALSRVRARNSRYLEGETPT